MYKKILVIKLRHIGDVLLTTSVFKILKENFPNSFVATVVNKGTEAVLEKNPYLDKIIIYNRLIKKLPVYKRYIEEIKFLREIKKIGFDTTIDLTGGDRAAVISYLSGAKTRIGIRARGFLGKKHFYTKIFEIDGSKHTILQNLEVLTKMGIKTTRPEVILNVTKDEEEWARKIVFSCSDDQSRLIHVHPTSRWLFKCWKDEYMADVIKWFIKKGYRIVLTSSPEEKEIKKIRTILSYMPSHLVYEPLVHLSDFTVDRSGPILSLRAEGDKYPPLINLAGRLTLRQLIAVSYVCDIYFGIDTAPMHIAAAFGKPVIALFGPSGAFHWGPWDNIAEGSPYPERNGIQKFGKNLVIQRDWQCIPCGQDGCEGSKISKCLFDIRPDEVKEILSNIL